MTPGYPPQPWHLRGQAWVSIWSVPADRLPGPLPAGVTTALRGRTPVVTAWVDYQPGGVLTYRELLAGVLVRRGVQPLLTLTEVWVDDPASLAGGRELWHIPKQLAPIELTTRAASVDGVAAATLHSGPGLPVRLPGRLTVAQPAEDGALLTPVTGAAVLHVANMRWRIEPAGPLRYLHGLRPLGSVRLRNFRMRFGARHARIEVGTGNLWRSRRRS